MSELHLINGVGDDLSNFLSFLYGESTGWVYVPTKYQNKWEQKFFAWPGQRVQLQDFILSESQTKDVYIAPSIFKTSGSALKSNVKETNVIWCEFDEGNASKLGNDLPVPEPSLKVCSSTPGNEHWYWKLFSPLQVIDEIESITRTITYVLDCDASGWDANQVLRPPLTKNYKYENPVVVKILEQTDNQYTLDHFSKLEVPPKPIAEIDSSIIPDVADVILKYPFNTIARETFRSTPPEGQRSTALMQLGYLCAEMGMTDAEIFSVIRNADDRWGKFKNRTDRNRRLTDLIQRVRLKIPVENAEDNTPLELIGLKSLLESIIELRWIVPDMLEEGGAMLLTGPPGIGKTQYSLRWAMNLGLGQEYLNYPVVEPTKVLMFSLEMGFAPLKYFLQSMTKDMNVADIFKLEDMIKFIPLGESLALNNESQKKKFEEAIQYHKPKIIIVDSLTASVNGELTEGNAKDVMNYGDRLRKKYNLTTWFIHHQRKAQAENKKPKTLDDVYGPGIITARSTSVCCLWKDKKEDKNIEVIELKKRLSPLAPSWYIQRTTGLDFVRVDPESVHEHMMNLEYKQDRTPKNSSNSGIPGQRNRLLDGL